MWFIGVEVEQETSAPPPNKNAGSAPVGPLEGLTLSTFRGVRSIQFYPLEITQREIIFEIEACERQGSEYFLSLSKLHSQFWCYPFFFLLSHTRPIGDPHSEKGL